MKKFISLLIVAALSVNVVFASGTIDAGKDFTVVIKENKAYSFGMNTFGQLGGNNYDMSGVPIEVLGVSDVKKVAAGLNHTLVLKKDGTVYAFGKNTNGQLGIGNYNNTIIPKQVKGLSNIVDIDAGKAFSVALDSSGNVYTFGRNNLKQLGIGQGESKNVPVKIYSGDVKKVDLGYNHGLILLKNGEVLGFGSNKTGALGSGSYTDKGTPTKVVNINEVVDISGGNGFSLFVLSNGECYGVGNNNFGQLGIGNNTNKNTPTKCLVDNVVSVSAGKSHSLFLLGDGKVYTCGQNNRGQLGKGDYTIKNFPTPINVSGIVEVSAGDIHSMIKDDKGNMYGFGANDLGQLGNTYFESSPIPKMVEFSATGTVLPKEEKPPVEVKPQSPFGDVNTSDWYFDAVDFLYKKGITQGVGNNKYNPKGNVTRADFIVMLLRAYDIEERDGDNFDDAGDTYYTGYLAAAKQLGISKGVGDNKYAPKKSVTRQEMFTLLYNTLKYLEKTNTFEEEISLDNFTDNDEISDWAKEAITYLVQAGIVKGSNNELSPRDTATRAHLAQIIYNVLK